MLKLPNEWQKAGKLIARCSVSDMHVKRSKTVFSQVVLPVIISKLSCLHSGKGESLQEDPEKFRCLKLHGLCLAKAFPRLKIILVKEVFYSFP